MILKKLYKKESVIITVTLKGYIKEVPLVMLNNKKEVEKENRELKPEMKTL